MQLLQGITALATLPPGAVVSIGNFDGVHLGHRKIIQTAKSLTKSAPFVVVTFEPHPMTVLRPASAPPRLTTAEMKQQLLDAAGVDALLILPPAPEVLNLTAENFWSILRDQAKVSHLIEGDSFNFGKGRGGNISTLRNWSARDNVSLTVVPPVEAILSDFTIVSVSSSVIRYLVKNGRMRDATICLGRPYTLRGQIIEGFKRGRDLGMPTANFDIKDQLVPADGVYSGQCAIDGKDYPAAISIGTLPTFNESQRQIEAFLIGYSGNLYGRTLDLEITDWVREQMKFPNTDVLKERMSRDIEICLGGSR